MRRTLQQLPRLSVAVLMTACTPGAPRDEPLRSARPAEQCQAALDSAEAGSIAVQPPEPRIIRLPQHVLAATPRGQAATLTLDIDTAGRVVADRIQVTGITDETLVARLKESAQSYRFWPALANGCAVPATYKLVFEL